MLATTSRERGVAIRSAPLTTLFVTALDLFRYSVAGMLSDFWHTFCREDSRCDLMMAQAKNAVSVRSATGPQTRKGDADHAIRWVDVARHISVMRGYLFEGLDQWVHPPWGRDWSGPQIIIRAGKCLPVIPVRDRHGRRSRRSPVPAKDRIGPGLLDSRWNPVGRRQRDGSDHAGIRGHDRRGARRSKLPVDFRHERRPPDRRDETRLAGVPFGHRPEDRQPTLRPKSGPGTRRASDRGIGNDSSACRTSVLQG